MMRCHEKISHKVVRGDTLRSIAERYGIDVDSIRNHNPGRVFIGDTLEICVPVKEPEKPRNAMPLTVSVSMEEFTLNQKLREAWEVHIIWERMAILGIFEEVKGLSEAVGRLYKTAYEIAEEFRPYFGDEAARKIAELFTEHVDIGGKMFEAMAKGDAPQAAKLESAWYANADAIAAYFASISPNYDYKRLRGMMYKHLDGANEVIAARSKGDYSADVAVFDEAGRCVMDIADYMTIGIAKQFL